MTTDSLSLTFAALADPTRRAILTRLRRGPAPARERRRPSPMPPPGRPPRGAILARPRRGSATVKELSAPFAMSGPAVSKHLRVLERAGLIVRGRDAQWRPCRLEAAPIQEVAEWAEGYRQF